MKLLVAWTTACAALLLGGCATMNQSIHVVPLGMNYPVSASSALYVGGQTLSEGQLVPVKDSEIMKYFSPKLTEKEVQLDLATDLSKVIAENNAKGIIKLRIEVENIDTGALSWISFERSGGVLLAVGGASLAAFGGALSTGGSSQGVVTAGIITTVAGAAMFAGSWLHQSLATVGYSVKIDGTAVRY